VSVKTGAGLPELRAALADLARAVPAKDPDRTARLPIDRVFTVKGFGTVVTGTLVAGRLAVDERVEVYPRGVQSKVRGLQVHGHAVERATAGQRTAVNLQGVERSAIERGDVLAPAGALVPTLLLDGTLELHMHDPDRTVHVRRVIIPGLEGEPAGILTLHEDVTAQRIALEAKDLMLRAIGHEVRSPAAAMKNTLAGIMQWDNTIDATGRRELLQEAYESSDRLLSLVESQLIIAKLETRHFEPSPETVVLGQAVDGVMGILLHRYQERSAAVEVNLPAGLPPATPISRCRGSSARCSPPWRCRSQARRSGSFRGAGRRERSWSAPRPACNSPPR